MKSFFILLVALIGLGIGVGEAQYKVLHYFNDTTGENPSGNVTLSGSMLYGMTFGGGMHGYGCIFSLDTNGTSYKDIWDFDKTGGNGKNPEGSLIIANGKLYGMTFFGGGYDSGCVFSIDTNGSKYKDLLDFNNTNGMNPAGSLILSGKVLYGMTTWGGANNSGCIFSIDTDGGGYKNMLSFNVSNGSHPFGTLILLGNYLYGMATDLPPSGTNYGNIFSIDTNGANFRILHYFNYTNGAYPWYGALTSSNGILYGMTSEENESIYGNIFSIDTSGNGYKEIFNFDGTTGAFPFGSLTLSGNKLYGLSRGGGLNTMGDLFCIDTNGNTFIDLLDFGGTNNPEGSAPEGSLTLSGNVLYGMTDRGGIGSTYGDGVIFSLKDTSIHTSINEIKPSAISITIYPNPNPGIFTIQSSVVSGQLSVEIYNVLGEKVLRQTLRSTQDNNRIELNQPNGVYFYRVLEEDGSAVGSGKIVVQK